MAYNPLAAGSKVYNGGSNVAQRGQALDPSGYIQRNLQQKQQQQTTPNVPQAQPTTPQGQPSQNRSGLAAAALSKLQAPQTQPMGGGDPNVGGLAPMHTARSPLTSQIRSFDISGPQFSSAVPTVQIPGVPTNLTGDLKSPLDRDLRLQRDQGFNDLNAMLTALQSSQEALGSEYQSDLRDFSTQSDRSYMDLASLFASMGGGPGTGYGVEYGDLTKELTNFRNDLDQWFSRSQQDLLSDRTAGVNTFQTMLRNLLGQQSDRDAKKRADAALAKKKK